jgi:16S rRNA (guanine966-N2)-methyltransferase
VRETVFNWLQSAIPGAHCLDLYAGSGALGFEALSRGAASAWLVERDAALIESLEATAKQLGASPRVIRRDALAFLREPATARFDVVFLDPPYAQPIEPLLELVPRWLAPRALVYVERPRAAGLPAVAGAEWAKRSHAGAVDYGLLRFEAATMRRDPSSEAQSP